MFFSEHHLSMLLDWHHLLQHLIPFEQAMLTHPNSSFVNLYVRQEEKKHDNINKNLIRNKSVSS